METSKAKLSLEYRHFLSQPRFGIIEQFSAIAEMDAAGLEREDGMIKSETDILAGEVLRPALTDDNRAGFSQFAVRQFDPQKFRLGVA